MDNLSREAVEIIDCEGPSNICEDEIGNSSKNINNRTQDFEFVCRICALKTQNTMPLFEGEGAEQKLMEKINKYLPIQISHDDGLPSVICYQCSNALLTWHELVECCVQADASFRKQLDLAGSLPANISSSSKSDVECLDEDTLKLKKIDDGNLNDQKLEVKRCQYCNSDNHAYFEIFYSKCPKDNLLKICLSCGRGFPLRDNIDDILQQPYWRLLPNSFIPTSVSVSSSTNTVSNAESDLQGRNNETQFRFPPSYPQTTNNLTSSETRDTTNIETTHKRCLSPTTSKAENASNDALERLSNTSIEDANEKPENEFSDHSDIESFAQLPESVFEAIEDTQDGEHRTDKPAKKKRRKIHTCPICGKVYTASSSYFYHKKHFHEQVKNYSCEVCEKKFSTRSDLTQHATVHTEERKYACGVCDKRFRSKASVYIHEQTHKEAKGHTCGRCGRAFRWVAHLRRHALRHEAARRHACATCGRAFAVRCDLLRHARTHNAGSFECDECHVKFAQMRYLRAHVAKKHASHKESTEKL